MDNGVFFDNEHGTPIKLETRKAPDGVLDQNGVKTSSKVRLVSIKISSPTSTSEWTITMKEAEFLCKSLKTFLGQK
jgi:hypothetical protein